MAETTSFTPECHETVQKWKYSGSFAVGKNVILLKTQVKLYCIVKKLRALITKNFFHVELSRCETHEGAARNV